MRILFIRHAESQDDLTNQYGGWLDLDLTENGKRQVSDASIEISEMGISFSRVLYSPLARARTSAAIISAQLAISAQEWVYLREKNDYGLLTGVNKDEAKLLYPELVAAYSEGYVFGSEPLDMLKMRVRIAYEKLLEMDEDLIAVTHGGFLTRLLDDVFNLKYIKAGDVGYILWDTNLKEVVGSSNFDFGSGL